MIYTLRIKSPKKTPVPHWHTVPFLAKKKEIHFLPGINIVYGANGSGKSTLLSALAKLTHCYDSNWPKVDRNSLGYFLRPSGIADGMSIETDGMPCRYMGTTDIGWAPERGVNEVKIDLKSNTMTKALDNMSAGQQSMTKLIRFLRAEAKKTKWTTKESQLIGKDWKTIWAVAAAPLKTAKPREGMPKQQTILLDEVDRSMDFAKQAAVWKQFRVLANEGHQLIVASHSPFAVNVPGANYIETTEGYLDDTRAAFQQLFRTIMKDAA